MLNEISRSTVAGSAGTIAVELNIQESSQGSVGFWDTVGHFHSYLSLSLKFFKHVRLGGSTGTGLTTSECQKLQGHGMECSAGFLSMHITSGASAYLEVSLMAIHLTLR